MTYLPILIAGFGGGATRGLVGFIKHQFSYKHVPFDFWYFVAMMFLAGVVGLLTAVAIQEAGISVLGLTTFSPGLSFIVGYAGGDMIENAIKIITRRPTLFGIVPSSIWENIWKRFL